MDEKRAIPWLMWFMLPILYVLSIGPVLWLIDQEWLPQEYVMFGYVPLVDVARRCGVENWLMWYVLFWVSP